MFSLWFVFAFRGIIHVFSYIFIYFATENYLRDIYLFCVDFCIFAYGRRLHTSSSKQYKLKIVCVKSAYVSCKDMQRPGTHGV